nr:cysteine-rich and transmembrane domain-containing protein a [Quercus suber]
MVGLVMGFGVSTTIWVVVGLRRLVRYMYLIGFQPPKLTNLPRFQLLFSHHNSQHTRFQFLSQQTIYKKQRKPRYKKTPKSSKLINAQKLVEATKQRMSYYNQQQPPIGVPPPQGYPPEGYPKDAYPPPGYPPQGYPPQQGYPQQGYPPPPAYAPQYQQPPPQQQSSGVGCMEGWHTHDHEQDSIIAYLFGCFVLLLPLGCLLLMRDNIAANGLKQEQSYRVEKFDSQSICQILCLSSIV